jgi:hypothetical protein
MTFSHDEFTFSDPHERAGFDDPRFDGHSEFRASPPDEDDELDEEDLEEDDDDLDDDDLDDDDLDDDDLDDDDLEEDEADEDED